jgi:hypothetical protein
VEDGRKLEPGLGYQITLDDVHGLSDLLRRLVAEHGQPRDVTDALFDQRVCLPAHQSVAVEKGQRHGTGQLHGLFFESHLPQQVVGALHILTCRLCSLRAG